MDPTLQALLGVFRSLRLRPESATTAHSHVVQLAGTSVHYVPTFRLVLLSGEQTPTAFSPSLCKVLTLVDARSSNAGIESLLLSLARSRFFPEAAEGVRAAEAALRECEPVGLQMVAPATFKSY